MNLEKFILITAILAIICIFAMIPSLFIHITLVTVFAAFATVFLVACAVAAIIAVWRD